MTMIRRRYRRYVKICWGLFPRRQKIGMIRHGKQYVAVRVQWRLYYARRSCVVSRTAAQWLLESGVPHLSKEPKWVRA